MRTLALALFLATAGCASTSMESPAPGGVAVVRHPNEDYAISVRFNQADIKMVIDLLARSSDMTIIMNSDISGAVTYSADQTPARKILDDVVHQCGLQVISGKAGILRVASK
jgi:type II secretory pathway component GspD/PulD (secretin)